MTNQAAIIIPARLSSTRLHQKLLRTVMGKSVLEYTYMQAIKSGLNVVIAVDSDELYTHALRFTNDVLMTPATLQSGTERLAYVVKEGLVDADIVVNWQADEPLLSHTVVNNMVGILLNSHNTIATASTSFLTQEEWLSPNHVKVLIDKHQRACYFSRAPIPYGADPLSCEMSQVIRKHIGMYAFKKEFLMDLFSISSCPLEKAEKLEQLSWLYAGHAMKVVDVPMYDGVGIDTQADLDRFAKMVCA